MKYPKVVVILATALCAGHGRLAWGRATPQPQSTNIAENGILKIDGATDFLITPSFERLSGTVASVSGGPGVTKVEIGITKYEFDKPHSHGWDGKEFVNDFATLVPCVYTPPPPGKTVGTWEYVLGPDQKFGEGDYGIDVFGLVNGNIVASAQVEVVVQSDPNNPVPRFARQSEKADLRITSVDNRSVLVPNIERIVGTVAAGRDGTAITNVAVQFCIKVTPTHFGDGVLEAYWNGKAFVLDASATAPATYTPPVAGSKVGTREYLSPPNFKLTDGECHVGVVAIDSAKRRTSAYTEFWIQAEPQVLFTSPQNGDIITKLDKIEGQLNCVWNGDMVTGAQIELTRRNDNRSPNRWNGSDWASRPGKAMPVADYIPPVSPATVGHWRFRGALPASGALQDGEYYADLSVTHGDKTIADNEAHFYVVRGPRVFINRSTVPAKIFSNPISGTAAPGVAGAVIASCRAYLSRVDEKGRFEEWTGSSWVELSTELQMLQWNSQSQPWLDMPLAFTAIPVELRHEAAGDVVWTWSAELPPAKSLVLGTYCLTFATTDVAGKSGKSSTSWFLDNR